MLGLILGWCAAWAAPQTVELPNGVRVVIDSTPALGTQVDIGWFTDVGSAHRTPGAVATALAAQQHGTTTVPADQVHTLWQQALGTAPTVHLCAHDAGSHARISPGNIEAWAWLASDALADTQLADPPAVQQTARTLFPAHPMQGIDRAPAPESWPALVPEHSVADDIVRDTLADLADPAHLVVVVRGDVDLEATAAVLSPYFERLPAVVSQRTAKVPTSRAVQREQTHAGSPVARVRVDVPADAASEALARTLDAHVATALEEVVFDARVHLMTDAPIWTLELDAIPMPGGADRVPGAWTAWLQTLQGTGLPPSPPPAPQDVLRIAHDSLYAPVPSRLSRQDVLMQVVGAPSTVVLSTPQPEDAEIDVIRRTVGELAAELVRIRLRELDTLDPTDVPEWVERMRADRDAVTPRLRPALDLLIRRAEGRTP